MINLDSLMSPLVKLADVVPTFENDEMALANGCEALDLSGGPIVNVRSFYKKPDGKVVTVQVVQSASKIDSAKSAL